MPLSVESCPKKRFSRPAFSLAVGQDLDRESLLERLVAAGYARSPLVEDAGDFSVRGFIIDLYPPFYPYPVRIEQMGDRIESIRFFDPSNQRSREDISEVHVGPVHTLIPDEESLEQGLQRLLNSCEERGVEKRVRQRLVDDFRHRVRFPGAECYLPYFFPNLQSLLDYIPTDSVLVLPDSDTLGHAFEDLQEEIFRGWESASQEGLPVPRPEELYLSPDEFVRGVARFRTVVMSPLEIEDPQTRSYRIDCQTNSDIRPDLLRTKGYDAGMGKLVKRLEGWRDDGNEVFLVSHTLGQAHRLLKLLEPYSLNLDFRAGPFEQSNLDSSPVPGIRLYVGSALLRLPNGRGSTDSFDRRRGFRGQGKNTPQETCQRHTDLLPDRSGRRRTSGS